MTEIDLTQTVAAFAADLPGAAEVFRRQGISFCCAGKRSLREAAQEAGVHPETLADELQALADSAGRDAPEETLALITHILERYHETHRSELTCLIPLAEKVERVHAAHPAAPLGLAEVLEQLQRSLDEHMLKEEQVLFPMMRRGGSPMIGQPMEQMRKEHEEEALHIREIEHVTHGLSLPEGACNSWRALYTGVRKLADDLVMHMYLENAKLFPRFSR